MGRLPKGRNSPRSQDELIAGDTWILELSRLHTIDGHTPDAIRGVVGKLCSGDDPSGAEIVRVPIKLRAKQRAENGGEQWWYRIASGPVKFAAPEKPKPQATMDFRLDRR